LPKSNASARLETLDPRLRHLVREIGSRMIAGAALLTMILSAGTGGEATPVSPLPVDLTWSAPRACPTVDAIRASIARRVLEGRDAVATLRAKVIVSRGAADHWRARLDLRGADWTATRTLEGPTCAALSDAAALVIVLALNAGSETSETSDESEVAAASSPPPPPSPPPAPAFGLFSTPFVGVGAAAEVGALPGPAAGGGLSVGWRLPRASVELAADLFAPRQGTAAGRPDIGARVWLATLTLRGCYLFGARVALGPCGAAGLDGTRTVGIGPTASQGKTYLDVILGAGFRGEWPLSRWGGPFLVAEAAFPLGRPPLSVQFNNDVRQVYRASAISLRCAAGLQVRFR
jgi:hypothetical protein